MLENAAIEPEVIELALFLQRMGARIELRPDRRFVIEGVERLRGAEHRARRATASRRSRYLVAGLVTGGEVRVHGCPQDRLVTAISTLQPHGRPVRDHRRLHPALGARRAAAGGGADRHPPGVHDRLADAAGGAVHPGRGHVGAARDGVRGPARSTSPALQPMGAEIELFDTCLGGRACRFHESNALHSAVVRGVSKLRGRRGRRCPTSGPASPPCIAAAVADGTVDAPRRPPPRARLPPAVETFEALGLKLERVLADQADGVARWEPAPLHRRRCASGTSARQRGRPSPIISFTRWTGSAVMPCCARRHRCWRG